jgi:hypothetical protein
VGAVGGAEGVVDIEVAVFRQLGGEGGVVLLLAGVEADVLQQGHAAVLHGVDHRGGGRTDAVAGEGHLLLQQLAQRLGHEGQAHLRHDLALGAVEVGQQDDLGALGRQVVDGRQGRAQAGVVGDLGPPSTGTLKSTRTRARLPARSAVSRVRKGMDISINEGR